MRETGQHTAIFGAGNALQQAINFVLLPVYTLYLTPSEFGVLSLLLIAGSLLAVVPRAAVGPPLLRSYYDYETPAERSLVVSTGLFMSLFISGVFLLCGLVFAPGLSLLLTGDGQYASLVTIVLLTSTLGSVQVVALSVFRAEKRSGGYIFVSIVSSLVAIALTIYLVVVRQLNIAGVLIGTLAGATISAAMSLLMIRHHVRPAVSTREIRKMAKYGLPYTPEALIWLGIHSADRLVIQALLGPAAVGLYAVGRRLGQILQTVLVRPFSLIEPAVLFSAEREPGAKAFYARLLTYYLLAAVFLGLGISLLAGDVLRLAADPAFWPAEAIVPWIVLSVILYGMRGLVSVGVVLKRQTKWLPIAFAVGAVVYLVLMVLLIPVWGLVGAAIALAIGYMVICFAHYVPGQRIYRLHFERTRLVKIAIVALTLLILGNVLHFRSAWLSIPVKGLIVIVGLPLLLLLLQFPDESEKSYLVEVLHRLQFKLLRLVDMAKLKGHLSRGL